MNLSTTRSCLAVTSVLALLAPGAAFADATLDRSVDQFTCKQVMAEPAAMREATIAFMHGYLLGKSNSVTFNIETLLKRTDGFIDSCLDNPTAKAIDILAKSGS
ncbi:HdeA/HdeB family chaperone [Ensifer sp. B1-9]|uniref:HdeA/HdeB family chaperone n=1 Tax=Ensifer sp. B1-9 TaxID=3141455 RepID=UPI003D1B588E